MMLVVGQEEYLCSLKQYGQKNPGSTAAMSSLASISCMLVTEKTLLFLLVTERAAEEFTGKLVRIAF